MDNENKNQLKPDTSPPSPDEPLANSQPTFPAETPAVSSSSPTVPSVEPATQPSDFTEEPAATPAEESRPEEPAATPQATPTPATATYLDSPQQQSPEPPLFAPKKKRKGLIIGIIIAAVLVVLGGAGAFAYTFWYQNPEKVVTDSIVNLIKADTVKYTGTATISGDMKLKVELNGTSMLSASDVNAKVAFSLQDHDYTLEGSARFDKKGDAYIKLKNLDAFVKSYYKNQEITEDTSLFDKVIAKVDNKWIKVSFNDLADLDEELSKKQKCVSDALNKFQNDEKAIDEIAKVYEKNKFITIKQDLGSKDWSLGYTIDSDTSKSRAFMKALRDTTVYKTLHDCDSSIAIDDEQIEQAAPANDEYNEHVELWVNQWTHNITKFQATSTQKDSDSKSDFAINPVFNEKADIETPKDAITLKQLQDDIQELMTSSLPAELDTASEV